MNTALLAAVRRPDTDLPRDCPLVVPQTNALFSQLALPTAFVRAELPKEGPAVEASLYKKLKEDLTFPVGTKMEEVITSTLVAAMEKDPAFKKKLEVVLKEKKVDVDAFLLLMAEHGLMINTRSFEDGKLKRGEYPLTEVIGQNKSPELAVLKSIFPDKQEALATLRLFYVRGSLNNLGYTQGPLAVVDSEKIDSVHKDVQTIMTAVGKISPDVAFAKIPKDKFKESVEVNELVHLALNTLYKFDSSDTRDWSKVNSGIKGYKIPDTLNVHEFISDCASTLVPEGGIPMLYMKVLTNRDHAGYAYAHALLETHLETICARHKTTLADLKKKLPATADQLGYLLALTTPEDVKAIQASFTAQTKVLMEEITRKK